MQSANDKEPDSLTRMLTTTDIVIIATEKSVQFAVEFMRISLAKLSVYLQNL